MLSFAIDPAVSFGHVVKERRRALGLTQDELARRVGCATVTIRKIEADDLRPSQQIATRLAMALVIPIEDRADFVRLARAASPGGRSPIVTPTPPLAAQDIGLEDLSGRAIRGYELGERIGAGGFGVVYRAVQPLVEREIAIKIILPEYANHPDFIRRFEAEAQLIARLEHPYIVPLYDYWREPSGAYLVMRLLRGGSLHAQLGAGPLPLERIARLLEQIGGGLALAHRSGVVHRDLKPANIMLDEEGNAYLADFGIAKDLTNPDMEGQTMTGAIVGSPAYVAPEQIKAEPVTPLADIYSLGVLLYELLTGQKPFRAPSPAAMLQKHLAEPLPSLTALRPDLPAPLDEVIRRATAKDPADRYSDVLELLSDFQRAMAPGPSALAPGQTTNDNGQRTNDNGQRTSAFDLLETDNPYKGLRAFREADAATFFGREALIQQLLGRMADEGDLARFLAVVGPSGSGKSSAVRAGLIPALRRGGLPGSERWFVVELLPGAHPLEEIEAALLRIAVNPPESLLAQLREDSRGLLRAVKRVLPADETVELVLVIDQFEEVFTLVEDEAARAHLLDSLVAAVLDERSRVRLVITLRADFIDRPLQYVDLGEIVRQRAELILPLTSDELERAIVGPAEHAGLELETGLVPTIVRDVEAQPGALPLLQYALTELYERRDGRVLTRAAYRASGGVTGALARRADALYDQLDSAGQEAARQLVLRLVTLGEGSEDTRRRVRQSEIGDWRLEIESASSISNLQSPISAVLDLYGRYRLLTFDRDPVTREPTVEVAHEALIRSWGRLRQWLDASRESLRMQRRLATAAADWVAAGRDASFLAAGARLTQFEGLAYSSLALNQEELAYLDASVAAREEQRAQEELARQHELEHAQALAEVERERAEEQTMTSRRLRRSAIWLAALALVALIAAAFAVLQQQQATIQAANAKQQAGLALARQLVVQVLNLKGDQNDLRLLLSAEATRRADIPEARASLVDALERTPYPRTDLRRHTDWVRDVAFSPDGKLLASASADKTIILWDVATHQPLGAPLKGHTDLVESVAFSPDGKLLASGSADMTIILWDVATHQLLGQPLMGHSGLVTGVAFSPDGKLLAACSIDKTVLVWDVATRQPLGQPLTGHTDWVTSVAFSPNGKLLVSGSYDKTVRVWDVATRQQLGQPLTGHTDWVTSVAFSPNGKLLAAGSDDRTVIVWDVATRQPLGSPLTGHVQEVWGVAFSPDGKMLATSSKDTTVRVWDMVTRQQLGPPLIGHTSWVRSVAFSPDGTLLASGSDDTTVIVWDMATRPLRRPPLRGHTDEVWDAKFSPDGKLLASGSRDKTIILWDAATRQPLGQPLTGHTAGVQTVAFSPDGKLLASASNDKTVMLWDVATHQQLGAPLTGHSAEVWTLAFSPDGKTLATGSVDKTVMLWDVATHQRLGEPLAGHTDAVSGLAFSPDGKLLASGSKDKTVMLWDVATHQRLGAPLTGHTDWVTSVAFSPDGKLLAAGSQDRTVILWEVATHQPLGLSLIGHTEGVWMIAFSPDGKLLASGSKDKTIILWDVATRQPLGSLIGHTKDVTGVAFSPDGKTLVSASHDKTVVLWDLSLEAWQTSACWIADRNLTQAEWNQFIGADIPYERTCPDLPPGEGAPTATPIDSR